jgi:hypothetical protein
LAKSRFEIRQRLWSCLCGHLPQRVIILPQEQNAGMVASKYVRCVDKKCFIECQREPAFYGTVLNHLGIRSFISNVYRQKEALHIALGGTSVAEFFSASVFIKL